MGEPDRISTVEVLQELSDAVGADGGVALYIEDEEGLLQLAGSIGHPPGRPPGLLDRFRRRSSDGISQTLLLRVPGDGGGVVALARNSDQDFTQQDRTLAKMYLRQLAEPATAGARGRGPSHTGWTRQLEAIQRIAARLTRLASVEDVGATICSETRELISYDEAHVLVSDPADGSLREVASHGGATGRGTIGLGATTGRGGTPARGGRRVQLPEGGPVIDAITRVARSGVALLALGADGIADGPDDPSSMLVVPLRYDARVIGVICLIASGRRRFDDDDLRLLQILADQAAVAVENAWLLRGRDDLVQELALLLEISEAAGVTTDEKELAKLTAARLRRASGTDTAVVMRWDEASTILRVVGRDGSMDVDAVTDVADSPARREVLYKGRPLVVQADDESQIGPEAKDLRRVGAKTLILLPLIAGGRTIGLVELMSWTSPRNLDAADMQACVAMASFAATGLEKTRLMQQLRSAADMDMVTGVHNHRYLQDRLRQEVARSARSHSPLAVLMLDLDDFKPVNDRHGHANGDGVLHNVGASIKANVRESDIVARYGGDEFVVLMPDTAPHQAEVVARRVVAGIVERRHAMSDGSEIAVGASAGLCFYPTDGRTSAQLLQAADAAMYNAKRSGGRQLEVTEDAASGVEIVPARATVPA